MNQAQSESLLSLLLLSIFVDKKLTLKESDAFDLASKSFEWHSYKPKDAFVLKAFGEARTASRNQNTTEAYTREKVSVFTDSASQEYLVKTLHAILVCDGLVDCEESFLSSVKAAFPI